jgi:hypothetical protein
VKGSSSAEILHALSETELQNLIQKAIQQCPGNSSRAQLPPGNRLELISPTRTFDSNENSMKLPAKRGRPKSHDNVQEPPKKKGRPLGACRLLTSSPERNKIRENSLKGKISKKKTAAVTVLD